MRAKDDEFIQYKKMQEQYRKNSMMGGSVSFQGGYENFGSSNMGASRIDTGYGGSMDGQERYSPSKAFDSEYGGNDVGNVRRNRAGLLGNDPMDNNGSRAARPDSSQRSVNEEMNRSRNMDGQDRYRPSKVNDNEDNRYGADGSNQLLGQLKVHQLFRFLYKIMNNYYVEIFISLNQ